MTGANTLQRNLALIGIVIIALLLAFPLRDAVYEMVIIPAAYVWWLLISGRDPLLITLIGMFAVINGALIQLIMASRVCYGMSCRGWLPGLFGQVSARTRTPVVSTLLVSVAVLLMALWFPIETLAKTTSYFLLLVFSLVNLSLWRLKQRGEQPADIICVPAWVPASGFLASLVFVLFQATLDLGVV